MESTGQAEMTYDQEVFMVVGGKGKDSNGRIQILGEC